jgi:hypothetical protein
LVDLETRLTAETVGHGFCPSLQKRSLPVLSFAIGFAATRTSERYNNLRRNWSFVIGHLSFVHCKGQMTNDK